MIVLRSLAFQVLFYVWSTIFVITMLPLFVLPRSWLISAARVWTGVTVRLLALCVGLRHEVRGRERVPDGPVTYAFKHQSAWETLVVNLLIFDPAIVLKKELLSVPFVGWFLSKAKMIGIDRKSGGAALKHMVTAARRAIDAGRPVVTFPEGTRSPPGAKTRYHPGIFALYHELAVPVVPVALNSGVFWGRRSFVKYPGRIVVEYLEPILPGLSRREFMTLLAERIDTASAGLIATAEAESHARG